MQEKDAAFCYTAIEMVNNADEILKKKRRVKEKIDYRFLLHNTMIATSSVLIDRKKIGDFRMPLRRGGQDYATWLMLLRGGLIAYGINETLVKYRVGNSSLSSNKFKSIQQVWQIQTQDEKIGKLSALFHVFCFSVNSCISKSSQDPVITIK
jgi:teichuronic acid biosynthesis glycosyltransferase TuaG